MHVDSPSSGRAARPVNVLWLIDHVCYDGSLHGGGRLFMNLVPKVDPRKVRIFPYFLRASAEVQEVFKDAPVKVTNLDKGKGLDFTNISAPASSIKKNDGVQWSGSLTPAIPPQVSGIADVTGGDTPDGGYLSLALFGVGSIGAGDDTITNFNVPTFYYGGEPYTRIGVVSNGYIVVGGGDSGDIVFTPQHFPNAARPNNTLAGLWSDLNPAGGGAIRVATLTNGPNQGWIVVDWDHVKNFGNATTHSFEIWISMQRGTNTGPASEGITYSYGPNLTFPGDGPGLGDAGSGDPDSGQNWGAENRDGSSGANIASAPVNGHEFAIHTTPPAAGGSATITYDASSKKAGTYKTVAGMTSNVTPGTTQVVKTLTVTKP